MPGHYHKRFSKSGRRANRSRTGTALIVIVVAFFAVFSALPLILMISQAFKPAGELYLYPPKLFPQNPTLGNFKTLFDVMSNSWVPFSRYLFNTLFVAVVGTAGHVIVASLCAYALAKHHFPGQNLIFRIIVLSLMFSTAVTQVPSFLIMTKLHMINTFSALILPAFASSLGLYLMKQFMETIPFSIIEAARIDGANEPTILFKLVFPNAKPAWLTLAIFTFQAIWNASSNNLIFDESLKQLPTAISEIIAVDATLRAGMGTAASLLLLIPPIVFFIITQSNVVKTMAFAGIKE